MGGEPRLKTLAGLGRGSSPSLERVENLRPSMHAQLRHPCRHLAGVSEFEHDKLMLVKRGKVVSMNGDMRAR